MESSETSLTPKQYAESVREHFLNSFPEHFNKMRLVCFYLFVCCLLSSSCELS